MVARNTLFVGGGGGGVGDIPGAWKKKIETRGTDMEVTPYLIVYSTMFEHRHSHMSMVYNINTRKYSVC